MPVLVGGVEIADDLDVTRVATPQPEVVRQADELDGQRVHAHQLGGHRVDGDLVGAGENHVLGVRHHAARARAIAREGAVHHGEDPAMNLLLDHQQVHERLVDDRMRPVPLLVEQPAERILHGAGGGREDVGLHGGQVDDVLADEAARNHEPVGIDLIEAEELLREIADRVLDVDPGLVALVEMDVLQAMRLDHVELLVLAFAEMGVDDHGAVVAGVDQVLAVAVGGHRPDHAVELPRRGRAAGEEEMPGDVDLERRLHVLGQHVLIAREVHQPVVIAEDRARRGAKDGNLTLAHSAAIRFRRASR